MIEAIVPVELHTGMLEKTCKEFVRAVQLIEKLDGEAYTHSSNKSGSVGEHFRHNIDFATNFLEGLEAGKIDYINRDRSEKIEQNRVRAIDSLNELILKFRELTPEELESIIAVGSEIEENLSHLSSVARELEFLCSHTIHHHAMIAEKLKHLGIEVSAEFGVSPSTLKYWDKMKKTEKAKDSG